MSLIRLGSLGGYSFEGPWSLGGYAPPQKSGIYAIMYKADPEKAPNRYSVIYAGQAENMAEEGLPFKHHAAGCWIQRAGGKWGLFIAVFFPPHDTLGIRLQIQRELIGVYNCHCNEDKYDLDWEDHWIGSTPLSKRAASEAAESKVQKKLQKQED